MFILLVTVCLVIYILYIIILRHDISVNHLVIITITVCTAFV